MKRRVFLVVVAVAVVAACVGLGAWQLSRRAERRAYNAQLQERRALAPVDVAGVRLSGGRTDPYAYRRATASGTYDVEREVVLRARSFVGRPGNHVLTPLRLPGGRAILVDRGWVPLEMDTPPVAPAAPPAGTVEVSGLLVPSEQKPILFGPRDPATGTLRTIGRLDLSRLARQMPYPLEPLAISLREQEPAQAGALPEPAQPAPIGDGPHLSYAIQWFLFAAVALVTAILLLRRERAPRPTDPERLAVS